jgi:hypothetical protein
MLHQLRVPFPSNVLTKSDKIILLGKIYHYVVDGDLLVTVHLYSFPHACCEHTRNVLSAESSNPWALLMSLDLEVYICLRLDSS